MAEQQSKFYKSKNNYGVTYLKIDDKLTRGSVRGEMFTMSEAMETTFLKLAKGTVMVGDMSDYKEITMAEYTNARLKAVNCFS